MDADLITCSVVSEYHIEKCCIWLVHVYYTYTAYSIPIRPNASSGPVLTAMSHSDDSGLNSTPHQNQTP